MSTATPPADFFSAHRSRLDEAVEATRTRGYYSAFPESPSPKVYGETAGADGAAARSSLPSGSLIRPRIASREVRQVEREDGAIWSN